MRGASARCQPRQRASALRSSRASSTLTESASARVMSSATRVVLGSFLGGALSTRGVKAYLTPCAWQHAGHMYSPVPSPSALALADETPMQLMWYHTGQWSQPIMSRCRSSGWRHAQ